MLFCALQVALTLWRIGLISILCDGLPFRRQLFVSPTKITHGPFFLKDCHHLVTFTWKCLLFSAVKTRLFFMQLRTKRKRIWSRLCRITFLSRFLYKKFAHTNLSFQRIYFDRKNFEIMRVDHLLFDFTNDNSE